MKHRHPRLLLTLVVPLLAACVSDPPQVSPGGALRAEAPPPGAEPTGTYIAARVLDGEMIWRFTAMEADGPEPCELDRDFQAVELVGLEPWACPDCKNHSVFGGRSVVTDATRGCYDVYIPESYENGWDPAWWFDPDRPEYWGWSARELYRATYYAALQTYAGAFADYQAPDEGETATATSSGTNDYVPNPYTYELEIRTTWHTDDTVLRPDPTAVRTTPYLCGWPQGDPGTVVDPEVISLDRTLPNLPMVDQCGEPLSLRDLYGMPFLLVGAAADCDACVHNALAAAAFATAQTEAGNPFAVVVLFEGTDEEYEAGRATWSGFGPMLHNRFYSQVMTANLYAAWAPSIWFYVGPDQTLLAWGTNTPDSSLVEVL